MKADEITQNADERWEVVVSGVFQGDRGPLMDIRADAGPTLWGMLIIIPDTFVYIFPDKGSAASWRRKLIAKHGVEG